MKFWNSLHIKVFCCFAFSDGCCPRIDFFSLGEKQPGSFVIQAEKVNENCHYVLEVGQEQVGIWMCGDSWWMEDISDKGQCNGDARASRDSKSNVQDNSLKWQTKSDDESWEDFPAGSFSLECVDICLWMYHVWKFLNITIQRINHW